VIVLPAPKLVVRYPTDASAIAALLPPGLEPCGEPVVQVGVYGAPVHGEPELGISTKVPARWQGTDGWYSLGIGIDQESAIFISREINGQPKFPCSVRLFRIGDQVEASASHQGTTFFRYRGTTAGERPVSDAEETEHEWWIKVARAVGTTGAEAEPAYDLPPQVVQVRTVGTTVLAERLDGELVLTPSRWDPIAQLLPLRGAPVAELVTTRFRAREITPAGPLDPVAFWPHADTIGGSRWPGHRGAPPPQGGPRG
jgi:acetoacetate decarboxylase